MNVLMESKNNIIIKMFSAGFLLVTVVGASLVFMIGGISMSVGTLLTALVSIMLLLLYYVFPRARVRIKKQTAFIIVTFLLMVAIQGGVSFFWHYNFDYNRFISSFLLLIIFLIGSFCFAIVLNNMRDCYFDFSVKLVFYLLVLSSIFGYFKYSPLSPASVHPVLFFNEPSHYALALLPFLLYMVVQAPKQKKIYYLISGYVIGLLITNLTLLVGVTLILLLIFPVKKVVFVAFITVVVFLLSVTNIGYYADRLNISEDNKNLSSLVLASGYERAYLNSMETYGLGVGFQQLGIVGNQGNIMGILSDLNVDGLNQFDGGSMFGKMTSEFGVFSVIMISIYVYYFRMYSRRLRLISSGVYFKLNHKLIFFLSQYTMYIIDIFVRGAGYFSSFGFFFTASLMWLMFQMEKKKYD